MNITYIHHSGYLVELSRALLLFDYAGGTLPELAADKDLIVFASHRHPDHFDPEIFRLAKHHPRIRFVLSDDIWQNRVPEPLGCHTEFIDAGSVLRLPEGGGVCVTAFHSTDEGVAFMIEADGKTIYHAGDLNDWRWNGEPLDWNNNMSANYRRELEQIHQKGFCPDAAMLPLDGRQEEHFSLGIDEFMRTVGAGIVFPMHFWEDYSLIDRFKALDCTADYRDKIVRIEREGQVFQV